MVAKTELRQEDRKAYGTTGYKVKSHSVKGIMGSSVWSCLIDLLGASFASIT